MKNIFTLLAAIALAAALSTTAKAQNIVSVFSTSTNSILAGLSNAPSSTSVAVTKSRIVGLTTSFALQGAGTSGVLFQFDTSPDNTYWVSNSHSFWVAATATATKTYHTNFDFGTLSFVRLGTCHNTNGTYLTNWVLKVSSKTGL